MKNDEFEKLLLRRLEKIKSVLSKKASEYSHDDDRLYNFHIAAAMDDTDPAKALYGMMLKHLVSMRDLIHGNLPNTREMVDEKIGDVINYCILLEAVFQEERENTAKEALDHLQAHKDAVKPIINPVGKRDE